MYQGLIVSECPIPLEKGLAGLSLFCSVTLGAFGSENGKKNVLIFKANIHGAYVFAFGNSLT